MFFQAVPGSNPGISRPFIVGLVMLLLFLSMQVKLLTQSTKERKTINEDCPVLRCRLPDFCADCQNVLLHMIACHCQGLIRQQGCLIAQVSGCIVDCVWLSALLLVCRLSGLQAMQGRALGKALTCPAAVPHQLQTLEKA